MIRCLHLKAHYWWDASLVDSGGSPCLLVLHAPTENIPITMDCLVCMFFCFFFFFLWALACIPKIPHRVVRIVRHI